MPAVRPLRARDGAAPDCGSTPQDANEQHYEVPAGFFRLVLGPHRKYSCCYYDAPAVSLADAEERALGLTIEHADLEDGQDILELGCGWGSLSLFMAQYYPNARITAVSNSHSQREFIENEAALRQIATSGGDLRHERFCAGRNFRPRRIGRDVRAHVELAHAVRTGSLMDEAGGRFFMHVFGHRRVPYRYEISDRADWIAQYFFTGGIMPSHSLPRQFADLFAVEQDWSWDGTHYQRPRSTGLRISTRAAMRSCRYCNGSMERTPRFGQSAGEFSF